MFVLGKFCAFDYGPTENLKVYGNSIPPDYNVTKITIPVAFYYGLNDRLVSPKVTGAFINVRIHILFYQNQQFHIRLFSGCQSNDEVAS